MMPVPYAQRRLRRKQLSKELPSELRGRIALRHVETVAKFSPLLQHRLAEAITAGVRIPAAIQFLKDHPEATTDEIIARFQTTATTHSLTAPSPDRNDLLLLANLLQTCFPDMPRATAEAMAESELLAEVLGIIRAQRICFESRQATSDFVLVVLCGLALRTIEQLKEVIARRTIYRQALQQSGLEWPY